MHVFQFKVPRLVTELNTFAKSYETQTSKLVYVVHLSLITLIFMLGVRVTLSLFHCQNKLVPLCLVAFSMGVLDLLDDDMGPNYFFEGCGMGKPLYYTLYYGIHYIIVVTSVKYFFFAQI